MWKKVSLQHPFSIFSDGTSKSSPTMNISRTSTIIGQEEASPGSTTPHKVYGSLMTTDIHPEETQNSVYTDASETSTLTSSEGPERSTEINTQTLTYTSLTTLSSSVFLSDDTTLGTTYSPTEGRSWNTVGRYEDSYSFQTSWDSYPNSSQISEDSYLSSTIENEPKTLSTIEKESTKNATLKTSLSASPSEYMTTTYGEKSSESTFPTTLLNNTALFTSGNDHDSTHAGMSSSHAYSLQTSTVENFISYKARQTSTKTKSTFMTKLFTQNYTEVVDRTKTPSNEYTPKFNITSTTAKRHNEKNFSPFTDQSIQPDEGLTSEMKEILATATSLDPSSIMTSLRHEDFSADIGTEINHTAKKLSTSILDFGCGRRLDVVFHHRAMINRGVSSASVNLGKRISESFSCFQRLNN